MFILSYQGSGVYWKNHIKAHGYKCNIFIIKIFDNKQECIDFCIWFSKINNIVKSDKWANLVYEDGIGNGVMDYKGKKILFMENIIPQYIYFI